MKIKDGLDLFLGDFLYDLIYGGYFNPEAICENTEDAAKVKEALNVVTDFVHSVNSKYEE